MEVTLQLEAQLSTAAGAVQLTLHPSSDCTVLQVLREAAQQCGDDLTHRLFADSGPLEQRPLQRSVLIFVNQQHLHAEQAETHQLQNRDVICLYPPISGG